MIKILNNLCQHCHQSQSISNPSNICNIFTHLPSHLIRSSFNLNSNSIAVHHLHTIIIHLFIFTISNECDRMKNCTLNKICSTRLYYYTEHRKKMWIKFYSCIKLFKRYEYFVTQLFHCLLPYSHNKQKKERKNFHSLKCRTERTFDIYKYCVHSRCGCFECFDISGSLIFMRLRQVMDCGWQKLSGIGMLGGSENFCHNALEIVFVHIQAFVLMFKYNIWDCWKIAWYLVHWKD